MPNDYNETLNLPFTEFPMRAGLPEREPGFLEQWRENDLYGQMLRKNAGKPRYTLHDGPPFSNNSIHMGTALNKVLKDFINRYKAMSGFDMRYTPGWDNHGMPIESAIIKQNKLDRKSMSVPEFRAACREFAGRFVDVQRGQFVRLGVIGDWDNPYLTMSNGFEAEETKIFGKMFEKGYIYKDLKPVYWCIHDETALAEAEIEYKDEPCDSIYVRFKVSDDKGKLGEVCGGADVYFVIWTTTPWTLPGNLAIALNPDEQYSLVKTPGGEVYILGEPLAEKTMKAAGIENWQVLANVRGRDFEYMKAAHPFLDRESLIVLADYVTMESGTGCVHTAPGYGADDFHTGRKYGLELVAPLSDKGFQTEGAGRFAGLRYDESNKAITEWLSENGDLVARERFSHSYPHCWRCKQPILFRAMPQWFCSVDAIKDAAIAACRDVNWVPGWGAERMESMILERSDWCISRQRHWGLPIPVFYCRDCEKPVCTPESIEKLSAIFEKEGSDAWYIREPAELLPESFVCPHCGGKHFEKETDTLDGWFDSGSTCIASMERDEPGSLPADMYLEGPDQYRGWFQSSLLVAVASRDMGAPYKNVVTHGWVVDGEGKAMHKSTGNSVAPETVIDKYGADLLRLWVASSDYRVDVRASDNIFKQISQTYLKIRNTCRYILGNLAGFDESNIVQPEAMLPLDKWAVTRVNALIRRAIRAYEEYEYHIVAHSVNNFCVVDMSNFYLDIIKDRLYCDGADSLARRSAQTAIFLILDAMARLLGPILPFTADEIWQAMPHRVGDDTANIVLNQMPGEYAEYALSEQEMAEWDKLVALRDDVNIALEEARAAKIIGKPLEAQIVLSAEGDELSWLEGREELLEAIFIVSDVELSHGASGRECPHFPGLFVSSTRASAEKCERCWKHEPTVGQSSEHPALCARCAAAVK